MNSGEEIFSYKDFSCEAEYQYDNKLFYPTKISVRVPVSGGFELRPVIFSEVSFKSKDECVNFLIHETQTFIDNDFEVKNK